MGKLTTHVLDTAHGRPGAGITLELFRLDSGLRTGIGRHVTNADGRCDTPLLEGESLRMGIYEIEFGLGDYFAKLGVKQGEPRFLDRVTLRFGVSDPEAHYHIPLLASPWSYSTYRGS